MARHLSQLPRPIRFVANFIVIGLLFRWETCTAFSAKVSPIKSLRKRLSFWKGNEQQIQDNVLGRSPQVQSFYDPQQSAYVPDGLSEKEYMDIKQKEADAQAKLNYGAWGPRFNKSERPQGDWLLQPQLWTAGFSANNKDPLSSSGSRLYRLVLWMRFQIIPPFILGFILIDVLLTAIPLWNQAPSALSIKRVASTFLTCLFRRKQLVLLGLNRWRMALVQMVGATALTPILAQYLEHMNRKRLWSKSKTVLIGSLTSIAALLMAWAAVTLAA